MASSSRALSVLRIVGGFSVVLGVIGLWYHFRYLSADYSRHEHPPYFFLAWYTMAAVNIALLVAGILVGVQLVRGRARWTKAFVILEILVVLDTLIPGALWLNPRFGSSVAAASGIAGGTFFQILTLFPIWGSVACIWAARRISAPLSSPGGVVNGRGDR